MITEVEEGNASTESDKEVPVISSRYTPFNQIHPCTNTHTIAQVARRGFGCEDPGYKERGISSHATVCV